MSAQRRCLICGKLYLLGRELTCSDEHHEELVRRLIAEFGEFKKIVRMSTGSVGVDALIGLRGLALLK